MSKNICSFLAPRSSASVSRNYSDSEGSDTEPPAPKKQCQGLTSQVHPLKDLSPPKDGTTSKDGKVIFIG